MTLGNSVIGRSYNSCRSNNIFCYISGGLTVLAVVLTLSLAANLPFSFLCHNFYKMQIIQREFRYKIVNENIYVFKIT